MYEQQSKHIFTGGMVKDADDSALTPDKYRHAENFRLMSDEDGKTGALQNILGNVDLQSNLWSSDVYRLYYDNTGITYPLGGVTVALNYNNNVTMFNLFASQSQIDVYRKIVTQLTTMGIDAHYSTNGVFIFSTTNITFSVSIWSSIGLPFQIELFIAGNSDLKVIGYANIEQTTYLFCAPRILDGTGKIFSCDFNYDDNTVTTALLYNGMLNFQEEHPIRKAIPWIDSTTSKKIYFTDDFNYFRYINVLEENLMAKDASVMDVAPDVRFSQVNVRVLGGGELPIGKIQYAYRLYNYNGNQSVISPASEVLHITSAAEGSSNTSDYIGSKVTDKSGKSCEVIINNIDLRFQRIKIMSIVYETLNDTPTVNVVKDVLIPENGTVSIVDDGRGNVETISYNEYNSYGNVLFRSKDCDSVHNYLVHGNIQEEFVDVDFDARAYRFGPNANYSYTSFDFSNVDTWGVHSNSDVVNPINDVFWPASFGATNYSFKKNSNIHGGTGPYISYKFHCTPLEESSEACGSARFYQLQTNGEYDGYADPVNEQYRGYQRDEVYRFGIVFYKGKGIASFPKWIADIRMPNFSDTEPTPTHFIDGVAKYDYIPFRRDSAYNGWSIALGVDFEISQAGIDKLKSQGVIGYQYVRVKRGYGDRRIVMQGIHGDIDDAGSGLHYLKDGQYFNIENPTIGWSTQTDMFKFMSPEININNNLQKENGDKIQQVMLCDIIGGQYVSGSGFFGWKGVNDSLSANVDIDVDYVTKVPILNVDSRFTIHDGEFIAGPPLNKTGSGAIIGVTNGGISGNPSNQVRILNYKRYLRAQYGGNTYSDRLLNEYFAVSQYTDIDTKDTTVYNGDIYITLFDYLYEMYQIANGDWNTGTDPSYATSIYIPLESYVNCNLRTDKKTWKTNINTNGPFLQEVAGTYQYNQGSLEPYIQDFDLYQYNTVYSREADGKKFFPRPEYLLSEITNQSSLLISSEQKQDEENVDSFLTYKPANRININSNYGEINGVTSFGSSIFVFQDRAVGTPAIKERTLVKGSDGVEIVLGTGDIMNRYDYVTTNSGTKHQFSIVKSARGIYYFNSLGKNLCVLSGDDVIISDIAGMRSWFYNNTNNDLILNDNPHSNVGVNGYFDRKYNEIVYSISYPVIENLQRVTKKYTIAYNEYLKAFNGFYSYWSPIYLINYRNDVVSLKRQIMASDHLYIHNYGNKSEFYGVIYPSFISIVDNKDYDKSKTFGSMRTVFESSDGGKNIHNDFFNYIRCYNKFQNTDWNTILYNEFGVQPITGVKNIGATRRERNWLMQLPRNYVNTNYQNNPDVLDPTNIGNNTRLFRERLRSQSLNIDLKYNNSDNYLINIPFLELNNSVSIR